MTVYGLYSEGDSLLSTVEAEEGAEAVAVFKARKVTGARGGRVSKLPEPEVTVYTGGKTSKPKGVAVAVAIIEGLPEGQVVVKTTHRLDQHPTPNSITAAALTFGIGVALAKGATTLRAYSSSKNAVRAIDGTGGAKYETARDAYLAAHAITWTRNLASAGGVYVVGYREAKDMPEVAGAAAEALKGAEALLAGSDELTLV